MKPHQCYFAVRFKCGADADSRVEQASSRKSDHKRGVKHGHDRRNFNVTPRAGLRERES